MKTLILIAALALPLLAHGEGQLNAAAVSTSVTSARSAKLGPGYKLVKCTVETHYQTGNSAVVSTTSDLTIPANTAWQVYLVSAAESYIAFILGSSTGSCSIYHQNSDGKAPPPSHASTSVDGAAIAPTSVTATGTITADNFVATTDGSNACAVTIPQQNYLCMSGNDNAILTYSGTSMVSNVSLDVSGGDLVGTNLVVNTKASAANLALTGSTDLGFVQLVSGTPSTRTTSVRSGSLCFCQNITTQANPIKCAVSGTTLTVTGPNTVTDTVNYLCITTS